jgi:hypothetical protein
VRLAAQAADERTELERTRAEVDRLRLIIQRLQRAQFGRRSERLDGDQLALGLEDLDVDIARVQAPLASRIDANDNAPDATPRRQPLPDSLAREDITVEVASGACPCCGGDLHPIGESVSEMLDFVPARLRVLRIRRPKYGCRACGTIHQAPAPERPIAEVATRQCFCQGVFTQPRPLAEVASESRSPGICGVTSSHSHKQLLFSSKVTENSARAPRTEGQDAFCLDRQYSGRCAFILNRLLTIGF